MNPRRRGPQVFAVEDRSVQLTWIRLPRGPVSFEVPGSASRVALESGGGPGTVVLTGLSPATTHRIRVVTRDGTAELAATTLPSPPGEELVRFATIGDLHLGAEEFGLFFPLREPHATEPHPVRCARSALDDLTEWGARQLVAKGDLVQASSDRSWSLVADLLGRATVPWVAVPGNHDLAHGEPDGRGTAARHGIDLVSGVEVVDLPGLRLVLMESAVDGHDIGRWDHLVADTVDAVAEAAGPAMLVVHHHPEPLPVTTFHPPGVDARTSYRLLRGVARANPCVVGTSGHTHRTRRRRLPIPWTEVGSTKDYPGVWAGYAVHEGGIRQVVRRVSAPDCLTWLDRTRHVAGGVWQFWTPGRLADRCFVHDWPGR